MIPHSINFILHNSEASTNTHYLNLNLYLLLVYVFALSVSFTNTLFFLLVEHTSRPPPVFPVQLGEVVLIRRWEWLMTDMILSCCLCFHLKLYYHGNKTSWILSKTAQGHLLYKTGKSMANVIWFHIIYFCAPNDFMFSIRLYFSDGTGIQYNCCPSGRGLRSRECTPFMAVKD